MQQKHLIESLKLRIEAAETQPVNPKTFADGDSDEIFEEFEDEPSSVLEQVQQIKINRNIKPQTYDNSINSLNQSAIKITGR